MVNKHKQEALMKTDELAHLQKQLQIEQDKSKRALEEVQQEVRMRFQPEPQRFSYFSELPQNRNNYSIIL